MAEISEKLISLKQAAELSGYTPDYVGQLIRKGKLPGKQVYANVAWMTSEEALLAYLRSEQSRGEEAGKNSWLASWRERISSMQLARVVLFLGVVVAAGFVLFLFAVLVTSYDARLETKALERVGAEQQKSVR